MDIRYISAGLFESVGEWIHPTRTIDTNELICVIRGVVHIETHVQQYVLQRGSLLHLAADTWHAGYKVSSDVSFFWMHYTSPAPTETWCCGESSGDTAGFLRTEQLFRYLLHTANSDGYPIGTTDLASMLLLTEAVRQVRTDTSGERALVHRINEWIRLHAASRIRVSDVAQTFGYNPDYITRVYRSACGITVKQAIDEARMAAIRSILLSGQVPLSELWEKAGFEDYKSFLKYFTYHAGVTPTEYRNLYPGTHINNR